MYERAIAYPVPFRLIRQPPVYSLYNAGRERLSGVTFTLHGTALMAANDPSILEPGEQLDVTIVSRTTVADAILVVRWFRPDGVEYLWRVGI